MNQERCNIAAENLQRLAKKKGVTGYQIAQDTGIPQSVIYRVLGAEREVSTDNAIALASYFGVTTDEILLTSKEAKNASAQPKSRAENPGRKRRDGRSPARKGRAG